MVLASRRRAEKSANCGIDIIGIHFAGKKRGLNGHKEQLEKGIDSGFKPCQRGEYNDDPMDKSQVTNYIRSLPHAKGVLRNGLSHPPFT